MTSSKEMAVKKIIEMSTERVSKVLIFMAGMEAEHNISEMNGEEHLPESMPQTDGLGGDE